MTPDRWKRVNELFHSALEREPTQRVAYLKEACDDDELREQVESLIRSHQQTGSFIDSPAVEIDPNLLNEEEPQLIPESTIAHYKIISFLGGGAMGKVYLAKDAKLGRKVALKLLPAMFTTDQPRVRRFEQEARAASALNHPNILTIFDIDEADGHRFIASEYIEGKTLRQHLTDTTLQLSEALDLAAQIGSALEAAHRAGIVHRDIKPENIMVRPDGYIKVLDFGLAKLTEEQTARSATESTPGAAVKTESGVVMGTPHYMSPEQARGLSVDERTDIFSLGVVIYEMVTGHLPFEGDTVSHVIVSILEKEPPPISKFYLEAPAELQRSISKALRKAKEERYQVVKDLLIDLKNLKHDLESAADLEKAKKRADWSGRQTVPSVESRAFTVKQMIWSAALVLVIGIGVVASIYFSRLALKPSLPPMTLVPFTSFPGLELNPAFSPDGNQIAFSWNGENGDNWDIYVKQIGSERHLRLTSDPAEDTNPVWSPDGQRIAFLRKSETEAAIFTVATLGGAERKLVSLGQASVWPLRGLWAMRGLSWSSDGKLIACVGKASNEQPSQIFLFTLDSLEKRTLTAPPPQSVGDTSPVFSPDSQTLAFVRVGYDSSAPQIYVQPIAGGEPRRLTFDNKRYFSLDWTADGGEIVFSSDLAGPLSAYGRSRPREAHRSV